MGYSGAGGKLMHEKNQKQKLSWHCPFKGIPSQDQKKTFRRCLIILKVTLTGQSHFMLIPVGHFTRSHQTRKWPPHTQASVPLPPLNQRRGGHTLLRCGWGGGGSQFGRLEKKPSTVLCAMYKRNIKFAKWILLNSIKCTQKSLRVTLRNWINLVKWMFLVTSTL